MSLTKFQTAVVKQFFTLDESQGYLLHGGAALLALGLTSRPTHDLDLFTTNRSVIQARDAFHAAANAHPGWICKILFTSGVTFCRLEVRDDTGQRIDVDLAVDSPTMSMPVMTLVAPTPAEIELGGRKLLAIFGRAESRDFADVFNLAQRFEKNELIKKASELDLGFDTCALAEMFRRLDRFPDDLIPIEHNFVPELRRFFDRWRHELLNQLD